MRESCIDTRDVSGIFIAVSQIDRRLRFITAIKISFYLLFDLFLFGYIVYNGMYWRLFREKKSSRHVAGSEQTLIRL